MERLVPQVQEGFSSIIRYIIDNKRRLEELESRVEELESLLQKYRDYARASEEE